MTIVVVLGNPNSRFGYGFLVDEYPACQNQCLGTLPGGCELFIEKGGIESCFELSHNLLAA